jgi:hypothetical protein
MVIDSSSDGVGSFSVDGDVWIGETGVRIEQLCSGRVFVYVKKNAAEFEEYLLAQRTISFSGTTANEDPISIPVLRYTDSGKSEHCFRAQRGIVGSIRKHFDMVQLRLTNVRLGPGRTTLRIPALPEDVFLERLDQYPERELFMRQTGFPTTTARLTVKTGGLSCTTFRTLRNDLTMALSVVQGRKVTSIRDAAFSAKGDLVWMEFGETITKDYSPSNFCFNPKHRRLHTIPLRAAADCFAPVREFRNAFDPEHRILNAWFDARVEADYLEARTLKYVVVAEALCHIVDKVKGGNHASPVAGKHWRAAGKHFLPQLRSFLEAYPDVTTNGLNLICDPNAWGNLNRLSFATQLTNSLSALGVNLPQQRRRIKEFVAVRNKIIHQFTYLRKEDFRERKWPVRNGVAQHFIVASFIDEIMLRLCGLARHVTRFQLEKPALSKKGIETPR